MRHHSLGFAIASAELASTVTSFGAVWLITTQKNIVDFLEPAKQMLAEKILYPLSGGKSPEDKEKAENQASLLLKGVIMMGTDFITTVATQMVAEGEFSQQEIRKAAKGKLLGMGATLVTLEALNKFVPGIMHKVEDAIIRHLPNFIKQETSEECDLPKEIANLTVVSIPAAVLSGIVSYITQTRGRER